MILDDEKTQRFVAGTFPFEKRPHPRKTESKKMSSMLEKVLNKWNMRATTWKKWIRNLAGNSLATKAEDVSTQDLAILEGPFQLFAMACYGYMSLLEVFEAWLSLTFIRLYGSYSNLPVFFVRGVVMFDLKWPRKSKVTLTKTSNVGDQSWRVWNCILSPYEDSTIL